MHLAKKYWIVLAVTIVFFLLQMLTIRDYGIGSDEPIHFHRGQAYLNYFLTGQVEYENDNPEDNASYFQNNALSAKWFLSGYDGGHPPLNGIMAAGTNYIVFQKMGLLGDIESYHLFNILASTLLVGVTTLFAFQISGSFAALITGIVISSYPLLFAEAHFNIKDPPEAAFITAMIWTLWMSFNKKSARWLLLSALFFGLGFGTKFNILFTPFMVGPYMLYRYGGSLFNGFKIPKAYFATMLAFPVIGFGLLFIFWPFLWGDPIGNFLKITNYYQEIGTNTSTRFNPYATIWIIYTTPIYTLVLFIIGLFAAFKNYKHKRGIFILFFFWLLTPILRVSWPGANIYGGVRQIMEFIPPMAIFAGVGAVVIRKKFGKKQMKLWTIVLLASFAPIILTLIKIHPNQNVYFNSLAGGLSGAKEKNIPYWGNSFGNAYWQAVQWLNQNAEQGANLSLIQGTVLNVPRFTLRDDVTLSNQLWSGINRNGEYLLELTHNDPINAYPYSWDYVEKFLTPVYEVRVDGVAIAKLWKNDLANTKPSLRLDEVVLEKHHKISNKTITVDMGEEVLLSRLVIGFSEDEKCTLVSGNVEVFTDNVWVREIESVPYPQVSGIKSVGEDVLTFFFPARRGSAVKFISNSLESCIFNDTSTQVYILEI